LQQVRRNIPFYIISPQTFQDASIEVEVGEELKLVYHSAEVELLMYLRAQMTYLFYSIHIPLIYYYA